MATDKLTERQKRFVEAYQGNAAEAAIAAGYSAKTAYTIGSENLRKPQIVAAIKARQDKTVKPMIANREARQKFWTETMLSQDVKMPERLKASELLGKSEGDFLERVEAKHSGGIVVSWGEQREEK